MSTKARARRKRLRDSLSDMPQILTSKSIKRQAPLSSRLEDLPAEILQAIFIICGNLKLPLASPIIYRKLSTEYLGQTRANLLLEYFGERSCHTFEVREGDGFDGWRKIQQYNGSDDRRLTFRIRYIQSALLRQSWFTWEFLRQCQWKFAFANAARALRKFLAQRYTEDREREVERMRKVLRTYFKFGSRLFYSKASPFRSEEHNGRYDCSGIDGSEFNARFIVSDLGECCTIRISIVPPIPEYLDPGTIILVPCQAYVFPYLAPGCQIPSKLLRGPWTQSRGNFLKLLFDASNGENEAPVVRCVVDYEQAKRALNDAIDGKCCPAIRLLVSTYSDMEFDVLEKIGENRGHYQDSNRPEAMLLKRHETNNDLTVSHSPSSRLPGIAIENDSGSINPVETSIPSLDADGPWELATGTPWHFSGWAGVVPNMEHVKHSFDADLKEHYKGLRIFAWICDLAIQYNGADVDEVLDWLRSKIVTENKLRQELVYEAVRWVESIVVEKLRRDNEFMASRLDSGSA